MAFTKSYMNELFGTVLVLSALLSTTSAVDCYGKSFHCVNSTHFMICVDLGGGVSQAIEDFYIACPPPTVCRENNHFECELPAPTTPASTSTLSNDVSKTTLSWEEIVTVSSLNNPTKEFSENYIDTTIENGTTAQTEYSITTDTTVDITTSTVSDVYIKDELNSTEIAATLAAEFTTIPVEIISQTLNESESVTENIKTTENILITGIENVAQYTADTINLTQSASESEVITEENIISAVHNTQNTTENVIIMETVTEQYAPINSEQTSQTTTDDPFMLRTTYQFTDLPQDNTLFPNENKTNSSLQRESSVVNKNINTWKPNIDILNNDTKNLLSNSEKANIIQPTVNSLIEITTTNLDLIPSDKISTDIYHGSTTSTFVNKLKSDYGGLHNDTSSSPNKFDSSVEPNLTIYEEEKTGSQTNIVNNTVDEISPTIGDLSTTPNNNVFPERIVTTDLPFVNDVQGNAIITTDTSILDNNEKNTITNTYYNEVTTILNGILANETLKSDYGGLHNDTTPPKQLELSVEPNMAIYKEEKTGSQTNIINNIEDETSPTIGDLSTTPNNNVFPERLVTTDLPFVNDAQANAIFTTDSNILDNNEKNTITNAYYNEVTTTLNGIFATETLKSDYSGLHNDTSPSPNKLDSSVEPNLTIYKEEKTGSQTNIINNIEEEISPTIGNLSTTPHNNVFPERLVTAALPFVNDAQANAIFTTDTTILDNNEENTIANAYYNEVTTLNGVFATETLRNGSSSDQPTTIRTEHVTKKTTNSDNVDFITTQSVYTTISNSDVRSATIKAPLLNKHLQHSVDGKLGAAFTTENVENSISTGQPTTTIINNSTKVFNAQEMVTEVPPLVTNPQDFNIITVEPTFETNEGIAATDTFDIATTQPTAPKTTQNLAYTDLDGRFSTENVENTETTEQPTAMYEQSLIINTNKNVEEKNDIILSVHQGTVLTETMHEPITTIDLYPMTAKVPSIVTKNSENMQQETTYFTKGIEFGVNTKKTETFANIATNTIPTKQVINTVITQPTTADQITTPEAPLLMTTEQNPITMQYVAMNTQNKKNGAVAEKASTLNEETSTTNTEQHFASENIITSTTHPLNHSIDAGGLSIKSQLITIQTPASGLITHKAFNSKAVGINAGMPEPNAAQNDASIIAPKTQSVKENKTTTEDVNVTAILRNAKPTHKDYEGNKVPLTPLEYTLSTTKTNSAIDVTASPIVLTLEHNTLKLSENNIVLDSGHETVVNTNPIELNFITEPTIISINEDTVITDKRPNTMVLTTPSVQSVNMKDNTMLNNQILNDNHLNIGAINKDLSDYANKDNLQIAKVSDVRTSSGNSKQNSNAFVQSESPSPKNQLNDKGETMLVTTDARHSTVQPSILNPLEKNNQNPESTIKSAVTNLNVKPTDAGAVRPGTSFVDQQLIISALSDNSPISDGPKQHEQSTIVTQNSIQISVNPLTEIPMENISEINSEPAIDTLSAPKSKIQGKDNVLGELGNIANVTLQKTEFENDKNHKDTTLPSQSVTNQDQWSTIGQDVSETTSAGLSKKEDIITEKLDPSRKPGMSDVLPLPINNTGLRSPDTSAAQNGNMINNTSYDSATANPTLINIPNINGFGITTALTPTASSLNMQAEITDKATQTNLKFGVSAVGGDLQIKDLDKTDERGKVVPSGATTTNTRVTIIHTAEISSQHPYSQQVEIQRKNIKTIQNVLRPITLNIPDLEVNSQNANETKREPQQINSPTNYTLPAETQKTYASSTVRAPSQSVAKKPISNINNTNNSVKNAISFTCINGTRGRYSDKDDCRKFYICVGNNQPIAGNCPENTVFSDVKKLCTKNLSHCIRQNEFKCPSAGRFSDFLKDNVYYICVSYNNHLYKLKFQCQKGYILNKTIVKCIETPEIESNESVSIDSSSKKISNSGDCSSSKNDDSSSTKKSNEAEETPEGIDKKDREDDEVFECKKEGKFPIPDDCKRYYLCKKKRSHYRRKVKKCDSGRVFHKDKKKCVDSDDYEC